MEDSVTVVFYNCRAAFVMLVFIVFTLYLYRVAQARLLAIDLAERVSELESNQEKA